MKPPKQKALVILTPGFPSSEADQNCLPALQQFVQLLQQTYPQVQVIVLAFQYPFVKKEYAWHHCRVQAFNGQGKPKLHRLLVWWQTWQYLQKINKEYALIGLLSFWLDETAWVGKKFGHRYGLPHYCWLQGQDAKKENRYIKRIKPNGSELIAISDFIADTLIRNHGLQVAHTIPIGVQPITKVLSSEFRDIDIIGAGSLIPLKQFEVLVHVVAQLVRHYPQLKVLLCGAGPLEGHLKSLIAQLELQHIITLTGQLPHHQLLQLMERSRLFLHPSNYEGFSGVCSEALNAGTPVLSFCQPMRTHIRNWHIVHNEAAMYHKALQLLQQLGHPYEPVAPYTQAAAVEKIMGLFLNEFR
jgi:glycosyltransferase involved in cell wall biosynthesis